MSLVFSKDFLYVSARRDYGDEDESINEKEAYHRIRIFSWCDPHGVGGNTIWDQDGCVEWQVA